jgi:4-carboxymuconolactone decarboxylase
MALNGTASVNEQLFDAGKKTRREVLGDAYVDQAMKNADEIGMPLQGLVAQY